MLEQLLEILGWKGGTIHQALEEVKRLKRDSDTHRDIIKQIERAEMDIAYEKYVDEPSRELKIPKRYLGGKINP